MTTGERIKLARKNAGLTQTELADRIGVKYSAIHKYESGLVVNLKRETIDAISKALDVRPSWLMCMEDKETPAGEEAGERLTDSEKELLSCFRMLSEDGQRAILVQLEALAAAQRSV